VLEDGRRWGEVAVDWQVADALAILDPASPTPLHFITRPRGGSKTSDLAGASIAVLHEQLPPGAQAFGVAADRDQARLLVTEMAGFIRRTPGLSRAFTVETWRISANNGGASLVALAADGPSAYGLRPHWTVADEIGQWPSTPGARMVWEAVVSGVVKVPGGRFVVLTTAGAPEHWSHAIRDHAEASGRWRLHEVPGPLPWIDPAALEEQRGLLTESQYARLHLNQWTSGEDRLTNMDDLRACVLLDGPLDPVERHTYAIGLDLGLKRDASVLTVAHAEPVALMDGRRAQRQMVDLLGRDLDPQEAAGVEVTEDTARRRLVLDRQLVWRGSRATPVSLDEVEAAVSEAAKRYNDAPVVVDPWQAAQMAERLRNRGIRVVEFSFTAASVGRLAQRLYLLLRDRLLALPDDEDLIAELAGVEMRETSPGVFRMDHSASGHDDRAISLALAAEHLLGQRAQTFLNVGPLVLANLNVGPLVLANLEGSAFSLGSAFGNPGF